MPEKFSEDEPQGLKDGLPKEVLRDLPGGGPEAEFIIRFFSVAFDSSGEVLEISAGGAPDRPFVLGCDAEGKARFEAELVFRALPLD